MALACSTAVGHISLPGGEKMTHLAILYADRGAIFKIKRGIFKMGNLYKRESLNAVIFKMGNL